MYLDCPAAPQPAAGLVERLPRRRSHRRRNRSVEEARPFLSTARRKVYDKWQFVYNPQDEIAAAVGQGNGQMGVGGAGASPGMSSSGQNGTGGTFGSSGSGFGSNNGGMGSSSGGFGLGSSGGLARVAAAALDSSPSGSNGSSIIPIQIQTPIPTQAPPTPARIRINPIRFSEFFSAKEKPSAAWLEGFLLGTKLASVLRYCTFALCLSR